MSGKELSRSTMVFIYYFGGSTKMLTQPIVQHANEVNGNLPDLSSLFVFKIDTLYEFAIE